MKDNLVLTRVFSYPASPKPYKRRNLATHSQRKENGVLKDQLEEAKIMRKALEQAAGDKSGQGLAFTG